MEGHLIVKAWKAWKNSKDGRQALNPYTLSVNSPRSHEYLENRLELAFQAGVKAAETNSQADSATGEREREPEKSGVFT